MKPGIYDITNEAYHSSDGISRSGIMEFRKSPLHFKHAYIDKNKSEPTQSDIEGTALHTLVLEPAEFDKRYAVVPKVNKSTKAGKALWEECIAEAAGRALFSEDDFIKISKWRDALMKTPHLQKLLTKGKVEQSIYWVDPESELLCKCRPDIWSIINETWILGDIKTTYCAEERPFMNDAYQYGYHVQAAMMIDGIQIATGDKIDNFIYIAVEKKPPFATATYALVEQETIECEDGSILIEQSAIAKGRETYKSDLLKMKKCFDENYWPSYTDKIKSITLPHYAFKEAV